MAKRPIFIANSKKNLIDKEFIDFKWFPGFSITQKHKSIESFHEQIRIEYPKGKILEVSSKSKNDLGISLSAFNLEIATKGKGSFSVENAFQSSKVFEYGGPYIDLLTKTSKEAKTDPRLINSGDLIKFKYFQRNFPLEPKTFFYNWLYVNALFVNSNLADKVTDYNIFTDIEFNPKKSINCQAEAVAIFVSLSKNKLLNEAMENPKQFKKIVYPNNNNIEQIKLL